MVMVYVCAQTGKHDEAIALLDQLLSIRSYQSVHVEKIDPWLAPLRDDPRFQALIERGNKVF